MVDGFDILMDDRSFIEVGGNIMSGRADHLDATRMRLVIGLGALETGQETVMDIDAATRQEARQIVAQYLHIARQDDEVGAGFLDDRLDLRFLLRLGILGDRQMVERHVADQRYGQRLARMVAHDADDIHVQLADAPAVEQVAQAMVELADHQQHLLPLVTTAQVPFHAALVRQSGKGRPQRFDGTGRNLEFHPHEEAIGQLVVELLRVGDVTALLSQQGGDIGDQTRPVVALQGQGADFTHIASPVIMRAQWRAV